MSRPKKVAMYCLKCVKNKMCTSNNTKMARTAWEYTLVRYTLYLKTCNIHFNLYFDKLKIFIVK